VTDDLSVGADHDCLWASTSIERISWIIWFDKNDLRLWLVSRRWCSVALRRTLGRPQILSTERVQIRSRILSRTRRLLGFRVVGSRETVPGHLAPNDLV
jgi:hypothetical protein